MNPLAHWLGSEVLTFSLVGARAIGVVVVAPLAWTIAPTQVRVALVLVLSLIGYAEVPPDYRAPDATYIGLGLASEFAIGALMGFVVRLAVAVSEIAGELIGPAMGLGADQLFDPGAGTQHNTLAVILRHLAVVLALTVGIHRVVLGGLLASYQILPPSGALGHLPAVSTLLRLTRDAFELGVQLGLPVLAVLFIVQIALAFIARAAPAIQIFNLGFAVTLAIGGLMMVLLLPDMVGTMLADLSQIGARTERLISEMGAGS